MFNNIKIWLRIMQKQKSESLDKRTVTVKISFTITYRTTGTAVLSMCHSIGAKYNVSVIKSNISKYPSLDRSKITVEGRRQDVDKFIKDFMYSARECVESVKY